MRVLLLYCLMFPSTINLFAMHANLEIHLMALDAAHKVNEELLFTAVLNNNAEKIKELFEQKKVNINMRRNEDGKTAVCLAAARGKKDALQELLRHNPDVNLPDNDGWTPLKKAADYDYLECARLLLEAEADPNKEDKQGYTPLMIAYDKFEMAQLLLSRGADVNHRAHLDGSTTLLRAANCSNFDMVKLLVGKGAHDSFRCKRVEKNAREITNNNAQSPSNSIEYKTRAQKCADFLNNAFQQQ